MKYKELLNLFWKMCSEILKDEIENPDKFIRKKYPVNGSPDWKIDDDILFLNLSEKDDEYAKQFQSVYKTSYGDVIRERSRTRVWELFITAYGDNSYDLLNKIKDGVFRENIKRILSKNAVFLIPNLPTIQSMPEMFSGKWWNRFDLPLYFNECYIAESENLGSVEHLTLEMSGL